MTPKQETVVAQSPPKPKVGIFVGMPLRGSSCHFAAGMAHTLYPSKTQRFHIIPTFAQCSLLTLSFNLIWSQTLNAARRGQCTHFAMIHDDIAADPGWLDVLMNEHDRLDADIVSVVVPIKDGRGLTSTARESEDYWNPYRYTMKEIYDEHDTFTHPGILLNTGCWLCRLDRPWVPHVKFHIEDEIRTLENGQTEACCVSEDWGFSRQIRKFYASRGGQPKLYATRRVGLEHERPEFTNRHPWGQWASDEVHTKKTGSGCATTLVNKIKVEG